jgi:DNA-binding CsgD family transcriptional regulator
MLETAMLTERERQCLRLVHSHFNSKQIARQLGIKPGTVDRHCENAARKLQAENRVTAALRLVAVESVQNDSQSEPFPMAQKDLLQRVGAAERTPHGSEQRHDPARQLVGDGGHPLGDGLQREQAQDGTPLDGGGSQTSSLHDGWGDNDGARLHRSRDARRHLQSEVAGYGRLGSIIVVFGVAAVAAWILTAIAGAEQFAFVLQKVRYGG